ncbi:DUF397 domain-containing protein [Nocardia cyriacigeorgica]|uniref:DUF397 domain-containing protein n=1 Tax=Nocardia cyriacigeorgica TaxID=135487 RepID=UPI000CEA667E|nr:DUF397 domain-containing protein [Nocardia cyriacigeorgica]AVH21446.1 DUF397 domain-containing protein [Nocardia cyriacigeorgica]MBF6324340.1 DUF397 domain-containing protein [Nocardia cyriacigeorgica]MBF6499755.1 DUF397 domain-containing protein [Nocardia cyriacigeorgica]PPJ12310.1 DUF397 domain-containing protein [Nocardia cyriacigeorgica]
MTDENDPDLAGAQWFTSTRTSGGKDCVEVAHLRNGLVGVRDSKNPNGPALVFTPSQWDAFTAVVARE